MDFSKLTLGDKILGGTAIALVLDLLIMPWHSVDVGFSSYKRTGLQSPNSLWGILALLILLAIIGTTVVRRLTDTALPETPRPMGELTFYAAIGVLVILLLKLIIETDYLGIGAYLAVLLSGGMVYGAYLGKDEADDALPPPPTGSSGQAPTPF